jgi:tetratricopeptide (TPR) repeat protein
MAKRLGDIGESSEISRPMVGSRWRLRQSRWSVVAVFLLVASDPAAAPAQEAGPPGACRDALSAGDPQAALSACKDGSGAALWGQGVAQAMLGRHRDAIATLEKARAALPDGDRTSADLVRAGSLRALGRPADAAVSAQAATGAADPELRAAAFLELGRARLLLGDREGARDALDLARQGPDGPAIEAELELVEFEFNDGDVDAARGLVAAARARPSPSRRGAERSGFLLRLAAAERIAGLSDDARAHLAEAHEALRGIDCAGCTADLALADADVALELGEAGNALRHLDAALAAWGATDADVAMAMARSRRAQLLGAVGRLQDALADAASAASALDRASCREGAAGARLILAELLGSAGDDKRALAELKAAEAGAAGNPAMTATIRAERAVTLLRAGKLRDGAAEIDRLVADRRANLVRLTPRARVRLVAAHVGALVRAGRAEEAVAATGRFPEAAGLPADAARAMREGRVMALDAARRFSEAEAAAVDADLVAIVREARAVAEWNDAKAALDASDLGGAIERLTAMLARPELADSWRAKAIEARAAIWLERGTLGGPGAEQALAEAADPSSPPSVRWRALALQSNASWEAGALADALKLVVSAGVVARNAPLPDRAQLSLQAAQIAAEMGNVAEARRFGEQAQSEAAAGEALDLLRDVNDFLVEIR